MRAVCIIIKKCKIYKIEEIKTTNVYTYSKRHIYISESSIAEKPGEVNTKSNSNRITSCVLNLLGCS